MNKKIKKLLNQKWVWLSGLILLGLVLRLILSPVFYHFDILSQAYWGEWIYNNGTKNFYYNSTWVYSWPTQPPLVNLVYAASFWLYINSLEWFLFASHYIVPHLAPGHMLWYFDFVKWYTDAQYPESYLKLGFFLSIKFIAIVADLMIAVVVYLMLKKDNPTRAFLLSALYLFSPFSFYISALWGQYDQISFLFLLLAVWSLIKKNVFLAPFLLMVSVSMKPTSLIFIPLFLWLYFAARKHLLEYIAGIVLALGGLYLTVSVFTNDNVVHFVNYDLKNKVFFKAGFRVSTNSFNFWHIFIGNNPREHFTPYLGVPAYIWGWFFFGLVNLLALWIVRVRNMQTILTAFAVVGLCSWLFMVNMLERYVFAGIVFSMMCLIYYPKFLKAWIVMSLIFWVNLYHGWWVPRLWEWLHQAIIWNDNTVTRILSAINVVIFFIFVKTLKLPMPKFLKIKK
jgi:Gpi18-like mannosyltransferase